MCCFDGMNDEHYDERNERKKSARTRHSSASIHPSNHPSIQYCILLFSFLFLSLSSFLPRGSDVSNIAPPALKKRALAKVLFFILSENLARKQHNNKRDSNKHEHCLFIFIKISSQDCNRNCISFIQIEFNHEHNQQPQAFPTAKR